MKIERLSNVEEQQQIRKTLVWSKEKINQLIELYKRHECLWNHWHEAYKSKDKRNRAVEEICKVLDVTKFEFGKKIHNLRNQFNTEMKKLEQRIEEAGVSFDDEEAMELRCKWIHFESLMFLRHVIEPRPAGYQSNLHPPKKMRLKYDYNSEDDINATTVQTVGSGCSNTTNPEDMTQYHYDDNGSEEVVTDDFQALENEILEIDHQEEVHHKKHKSPQQLSKNATSSEVSSRSFIKSNKKPFQTDITNNNDDSSLLELSSNNVTVIPSHSSTTTSITTPVISSITSNASIRPSTILRDQWDAFGELVANELRNLNSEISRKRLKRKIMQAMLEVGEEDDNLIDNRLRKK